MIALLLVLFAVCPVFADNFPSGGGSYINVNFGDSTSKNFVDYNVQATTSIRIEGSYAMDLGPNGHGVSIVCNRTNTKIRNYHCTKYNLVNHFWSLWLWRDPADAGAFQTVRSGWDGTNHDESFYYDSRNGQFNWNIQLPGQSSTIAYVMPKGRWVHITMIRRGNEYRMFENGVYFGNSTTVIGSVYHGWKAIAADPVTANTGFLGKMSGWLEGAGNFQDGFAMYLYQQERRNHNE